MHARSPSFASTPVSSGSTKDVAVSRVTVHGDHAETRAQSFSNAVVTADYRLVKAGGEWSIERILATS